MKCLCVVLALALSATTAVADMLPAGNYVQEGEGGNHTATSVLGGHVVVFDGQWFFWTGSFYTNGLCILEFFELLEGEYGWILACPDALGLGIVTEVR